MRPVIWWSRRPTPARVCSRVDSRIATLLVSSPVGALYHLSFFLGIGYLAAIVGPLDRHTLLVLIGVSAGWWGIWGLWPGR